MPSVEKLQSCPATVWEYLALPDAELERADVVAMNLTVAKGVGALAGLDIPKYVAIVDSWTTEFARRLPASERTFHRHPDYYKNDIRFFRMGMLQLFLNSVVGIQYKHPEIEANYVLYQDPEAVFLNGLIDSKLGDCGNMAALHVAMARRMGWPVSVAVINNHRLSRYDDGEVTHNIEASHGHAGKFFSGSDEKYGDIFNLPEASRDRGIDLRRLTAREMLGTFIWSRARHFNDVGKFDLADDDYGLARHLLPRHRYLFREAVMASLKRGELLFDPGEIGHPGTLAAQLGMLYPDVGLGPVHRAGPAVYVRAPAGPKRPPEPKLLNVKSVNGFLKFERRE